MMRTDTETKFDVPPDFVMPAFTLTDAVPAEEPGPDATSVPGTPAAEPAIVATQIETVRIVSTYYDTGDGRLLRFGITLRHHDGRTAGSDAVAQADTIRTDVPTGEATAGWTLTVPAGRERTERYWPSTERHPEPELADELADLLRPFLRCDTVGPSVRLDVVRSRHQLFDARYQLAAVVADDDVHALGLQAQVRAPRWREVEVEMGPAGRRKLLVGLRDQLIAAGAFTSTSRSKLDRARVGIGNEGIGTPRTSAGAVLQDYMAEQALAIFGGHFTLHAELDYAVHRTRVAARRLRSTLRTFQDCFDADQAADFQAELKWFADVLGRVRDREVSMQRLTEAVDHLPADLVVGPVAERVKHRLSDELALAQQDLRRELGGDRYSRLLSEILRWRDDPPFTAAAGRPAATLDDAVRRSQKRLVKRFARATGHHNAGHHNAGHHDTGHHNTGPHDTGPHNTGTDDELHAARRAGKQVRYAAEATADDGPDADDELVVWSTAIQDLLGEFHDSVIAVDTLRRLAELAAANAEDTFTYGVLVAQLRARADRRRRHLRERAARLHRPTGDATA